MVDDLSVLKNDKNNIVNFKNMYNKRNLRAHNNTALKTEGSFEKIKNSIKIGNIAKAYGTSNPLKTSAQKVKM